jgi:BRO family, N-terminal domain
MANELAVFQDRIRRLWYENAWWFSVVDVVGVLTDSPNPAGYWRVMKLRLKSEGSQSVTDCNGLKMKSPDGKMRTTDAATTETILRIIQSIPSPKAEPFKAWLARVGTERIQEEAELTASERRLMTRYRRLGYTDTWIDQRLQAIQRRTAVTGEWGLRGAKKGREYAVLTDTLSVGAFDITTREHRQIKELSARDNLQDSQTIMELAITGLADAAAVTLHQERDSRGFPSLQGDCHEAGKIAGDARRQFEAVSGKPVVSPVNHKQLQQERQRELQPGLFDQSED